MKRTHLQFLLLALCSHERDRSSPISLNDKPLRFIQKSRLHLGIRLLAHVVLKGPHLLGARVRQRVGINAVFGLGEQTVIRRHSV